MKFGNFWEEDQIKVSVVTSAAQIPDDIYGTGPGSPAFIAVIQSTTTRLAQYVFVEIVPGTQRHEYFLNLDTAQFEYCLCADVNVYEGRTHKFEDMVLAGKDSWPLNWFNLTNIPDQGFDARSAYDRAMAIVGS